MASHLNVTLRQMRAFVEAYRLRNLTHAAEAVHVSQSAMSALIRQFEEELGCTLFERTPRVLRPTRAADDAYRQVVAILKGVQVLGDEMQARAEEFEKQLAFSCSPALAAAVIPTVLANFKKRHPEVKVAMHDAYDTSLIERVLTEEVEFSIGFFDHEPEAVTSQALIVDHLCAVCNASNPLAQKERVTWKDMQGQPMIKIAKGAQIHQLVTDAISSSGGTVRPAHEVSFIHTALAFAAQGLGVLVIPGYLIRGNPHMSSLVARTLHDPLVERSLLVHTRQGHSLSTTATAFLDMVRDQLERPA